MDIDRNAAAIIGDSYRVVFINNNINAVAIPSHGLVNGVIHDLIDQMVQPARAGITDIHRRTPAYRLDPL